MLQSIPNHFLFSSKKYLKPTTQLLSEIQLFKLSKIQHATLFMRIVDNLLSRAIPRSQTKPATLRIYGLPKNSADTKRTRFNECFIKTLHTWPTRVRAIWCTIHAMYYNSIRRAFLGNTQTDPLEHVNGCNRRAATNATHHCAAISDHSCVRGTRAMRTGRSIYYCWTCVCACGVFYICYLKDVRACDESAVLDQYLIGLEYLVKLNLSRRDYFLLN